MSKESNEGIHGRENESHACLVTSISLFLSRCCVLTRDESCQAMYSRFTSHWIFYAFSYLMKPSSRK
jgi:hypothetical protein